MLQKITEGKATIFVHKENKISKQLPVFYNPVMENNRDISILLLQALNKEDLRIADILAGSGVRSIRFLKEVPSIQELHINDQDPEAIKLIKRNLRLNNLTSKKISVTNREAGEFLLSTCGFDYIEVDPFGSPNPFLDASIKRLSRGAILAVTATDTAALCGTYPKAGRRKYWAQPKKCAVMHEFGLRILIRKVQLMGAQYDKALTPLFSYFKDHYFRVFFQSEKGKDKVDNLLSQHDTLHNAGPLWVGKLWDYSLTKKILTKAKKHPTISKNNNLMQFLTTIEQESQVDSDCFVDIHDLCKNHKIKDIPKKQELINTILKKKFQASPTHFTGEGIRTSMPQEKLITLLK